MSTACWETGKNVPWCCYLFVLNGVSIPSNVIGVEGGIMLKRVPRGIGDVSLALVLIFSFRSIHSVNLTGTAVFSLTLHALLPDNHIQY